MNRDPTEQARQLRQQDVPAERKLWSTLRDRRLAGFKFRRQHPVGRYIVDFACVEVALVVEIDGVSHLSREGHDAERTHALEAEGWNVVRYWNTEVYDEFEAVKEAIYRECERLKERGKM